MSADAGRTLRTVLRWAHWAGAAGLIAAIGARLWLAPPRPEAAAWALQAGVLLTVLGGLALLARRPDLLERRWLLAKLLLAMGLAGALLRGDAPGLWGALALAAAAVLLGLWRPRLGQPLDADKPR